MQQIVEQDAASVSVAFNPRALEILTNARKTWTDAGGELIELPGEERSEMLKTLSSVGADVSKDKPALSAAYQVVSEAAQRYQ